MNTISETDIKISKLSEDDRLLYDAGWADYDGKPTSTGWEILKGIVFDANKTALIELAKTVIASKPVEVDEDDD